MKTVKNIEKAKAVLDSICVTAQNLGVEFKYNIETSFEQSEGVFYIENNVVTYELPQIEIENNFRLVGHVNMANGTNIVTGDVPKTFWDNPNVCDHCGHKRNRNKIYIFKREDDKYFRLGSTCTKYFQLKEGIELFLDNKVIDTLLDMDEISEKYYTPKKYVKLEDFLSMTIFFINLFGYKSSKEYEHRSTGNDVIEFFEEPRDHEDVLEKIVENIEEARKIIAFFKNKEEDYFSENNYRHNIGEIVNYGYVLRDTANFAAAIVIAYRKENMPSWNDSYIGNIGDNVTIKVKFERSHIFEGRYGISNVLVFRSNENHQIVWFTNSKTASSFDSGWFNLKGKVKNHSEFKGVKQTALTRCKVC